MKMLILGIGQQKAINNYVKSGFSLLETLVVISIISILGFFISISFNFFNKDKINISINDKINLITSEINHLKQYSLSKNFVIELENFKNFNHKIINNSSFKNCSSNNDEIKSYYIFPSGRTSEMLLKCKVNNTEVLIKINDNGKASKHVQ